MGIYARCVLPRLIHVSMGEARVQPYWSRVIGGANPTINMVQFRRRRIASRRRFIPSPQFFTGSSWQLSHILLAS
jgi:hypothetical protein